MTLLSDIVMDESEVEIEGESVGVCPIDGDRRFVFEPDDGQFVARSSNGTDRVIADGEDGRLTVRDSNGTDRVTVDGGDGRLTVGDSNGTDRVITDGEDGRLTARDSDGTDRISLESEHGRITLYDEGVQSNPTIILNGDRGSAKFGTEGQAGVVELLNEDANIMAHIDGAHGRFIALDYDGLARTVVIDGPDASVRAGGSSKDGTFEAVDRENNTRITVNGHRAHQNFYDDEDVRNIHIDGQDAHIEVGNELTSGSIELRSEAANSQFSMIRLDSNAGLTMTRVSKPDGDAQIVELTDDATLGLGGANDSQSWPGTIELRDETGEIAGGIRAQSGSLVFVDANGAERLIINENGVTEP